MTRGLLKRISAKSKKMIRSSESSLDMAVKTSLKVSVRLSGLKIFCPILLSNASQAKIVRLRPTLRSSYSIFLVLEEHLQKEIKYYIISNHG